MARFYKVALFAAAISLFLASAGLTKGLNRIASAETQSGDNHLIDVQSASGKITAVRRHRFTIEIQQVKPPGEGFQQEDRTSSMTFLVNASTKVEGKLEVGANADVVYQQKDRQYVAVTVRVTPIS